MKEYDAVIIGAGTTGMTLLGKALPSGAKTALINEGPLGGTCLNYGCVPSKLLIYPADVVALIRRAAKLGIEARINRIDFGAIMDRMKDTVSQGRESSKDFVESSENLDFYPGRGHFIDEHTLEAAGERIQGANIFIASGSRDMVPPVAGLDTIDYLTSKTLLLLKERPESMIIIGGGFVAVEYGHFFEALGARVTILQQADRLIPQEEPEISGLLMKELGKRVGVHTGITVTAAKKNKTGCTVGGKDAATGEYREFKAERVLVAAGRESNADLLGVQRAGIETDERNYIRVNEYLETSRPDIWAFGDAIDNLMFTHSGDREAEIAWHNATNSAKRKMDFGAVPHAVYSWPQIASVGMTEEKARESHDIVVGRANYSDIVKGEAMMEEEGFAKAVVDKESRKILGFHIIGPEAPVLIQEVVNVMEKGGTIDDITGCMHIFPALSELVPEALGNLREVKEPAPA